MPIGTLPFCFTGLLMLLTQSKIPGFQAVPISDVSTPEDHLFSARVGRIEYANNAARSKEARAPSPGAGDNDGDGHVDEAGAPPPSPVGRSRASSGLAGVAEALPTPHLPTPHLPTPSPLREALVVSTSAPSSRIVNLGFFLRATGPAHAPTPSSAGASAGLSSIG